MARLDVLKTRFLVRTTEREREADQGRSRLSRPALVLAVMLGAMAGGAGDCRAGGAPAHGLDRAREAAGADRNELSSRLFAEAIAAEPGLSGSVLREYADQLMESGRAAEAVPFYREALAGQPSGEELRRTRRGFALALLWSGANDEAIAAWRQIFLANPADDDARRNLSGALSGAAREAARTGRSPEAADLYLMAMDVVPERRLELALECADQLTHARRLAEAVAMYEEALEGGRLDEGSRTRALLGLALALSRSGGVERLAASL